MRLHLSVRFTVDAQYSTNAPRSNAASGRKSTVSPATRRDHHASLARVLSSSTGSSASAHPSATADVSQPDIAQHTAHDEARYAAAAPIPQSGPVRLLTRHQI